MAGNDTAALVVALSAQLTRFEKDMKRAGDIADRQASQIEDRFSRLNPFAGTFLGNFAANFAKQGLDKAIDFVQDLTRRFVELDATAKLVGASMNDIFGVQQAASKAGAPVDDVTASLKNLAILLDQVQRGEKNSLSELFADNPKALKDVNVQALNLQQTFALVADLVQNARTEIQKIDVAKAAGQAETLVRFLEQGGEAVTYLSKNAAAAAPDLQRLADQAKVFDEAWKTAVQNVKAYLAEHLFDFIKTDLQDLISLLDTAVRFLGLFKGGLLDAQAASASTDLAKTRDALIAFQNRQTQVDESAGLDTSANARNDRRAPARVVITGQGTSTADRSRPLTNVPLKSTSEDENAFDRAQDQLEKRIAQINAEAKAQGLGVQALAAYRAEAQLTTAAQQAGIPVTEALKDKIQALAKNAGDAALALEKAGLASDISRGRQTALLSPEDAQIAAQLKGIYPDVATALDSVEASALRANQSLREASTQISGELTSGLTDIVSGAKSASDGFNDMAKSIIRDIEQMIIKLTIIGPLMRALQTGFGGLFGNAGINLNGSIAGAVGPTSIGGAPLVPAFASGTDNAPGGLALVGERGPEIVNLPRGSQVIPNAALRAGGGGMVTINNYTDGQPSVQRGSNGDVTVTIRKMVDQAVGNSLVAGTGRRVLGSSYGVKPFTGR
jgi:hypothetical protein